MSQEANDAYIGIGTGNSAVVVRYMHAWISVAMLALARSVS